MNKRKNGFMMGLLFTVYVRHYYRQLIFNPHNNLPRQILIIIFLLRSKESLQLVTEMEWGVELRFGLKVLYRATCLLYFLLVKYTPRCKCTEVRHCFIFSPLCLSQSLASSLILKKCWIKVYGVGLNVDEQGALTTSFPLLLAIISPWASVMRRMFS